MLLTFINDELSMCSTCTLWIVPCYCIFSVTA